MSSLTGGFVLAALAVLASGYLVYGARVCRWRWSKSAGYVLYFRIAVAGLLLVFPAAVAVKILPVEVLLCALGLRVEPLPIAIFLLALGLRLLADGGARLYGKYKPTWEYQLVFRNLNVKGLDQTVFEVQNEGKMLMVTLKNNTVHVGWPMEAPDHEDEKWLRLIPQWSGYLDNRSVVHPKVDYSAVFGTVPVKDDHMLIAVDEIIMVQPFEEDAFTEAKP